MYKKHSNIRIRYFFRDPKILYIVLILLIGNTISLKGNNKTSFKYIINIDSGIFFINPEKFNDIYLKDFLDLPAVKNGINLNLNFGYNLYNNFIIKMGVGYSETLYNPKGEWMDNYNAGGTNIGQIYFEIVPKFRIKYLSLCFSKLFSINRLYPEIGINFKYNLLDEIISTYLDETKSPGEIIFNDSALSWGFFFNIQYRIWKGLLLGIETGYEFLIFDEIKNERGDIWYWNFHNGEKAIIDHSGMKISLKASYMI